MRRGRSRRGERNITKSGRTAVLGIGRRGNMRGKWAVKRAVEKALRGKPKAGFPQRLEIPQRARDSHFPTAPAATASPAPMSYHEVHGKWGQVIALHRCRGEGK